jgi:hypothetical protein
MTAAAVPRETSAVAPPSRYTPAAVGNDADFRVTPVDPPTATEIDVSQVPLPHPRPRRLASIPLPRPRPQIDEPEPQEKNLFDLLIDRQR